MSGLRLLVGHIMSPRASPLQSPSSAAHPFANVRISTVCKVIEWRLLSWLCSVLASRQRAWQSQAVADSVTTLSGHAKHADHSRAHYERPACRQAARIRQRAKSSAGKSLAGAQAPRSTAPQARDTATVGHRG